MSISNFLEEKLLNHVFRAVAYTAPANVHISLHTADPGETGTSEVTGGSYSRKQAAFDPAVNPGGTISSNAELQWLNMPSATVTHVGVWDAASGGNFLWGGPLSTPKVIAAGDTFKIASGDLDVSLD